MAFVETNQTYDLKSALEQLQKLSPVAPFLALGQTPLWDEPMKAGVLLASQRLGYERTLTAGVHDTDYFAKLPGEKTHPGEYEIVAHNDTTTRGLWSAAAEFSTLFGSETVLTREMLAKSGLRIDKLLPTRPNLLDEATEAWGWRGVVSLDEKPPITADIPFQGLKKKLFEAFDWALSESMNQLCCTTWKQGAEQVKKMRSILEKHQDAETLSEFYERILPEFYALTASEPIESGLETTRTTRLLKFNLGTFHLPRFELLGVFLDPETRTQACHAYDEAIQGSGLYGLDRFGTGALPFDVIVPGHGRGTLRVAPKAIVIMTPKPLFITLKRPVHTPEELAEALCAKFGDECVLVGKAVTLIGMLAREFVFLFHEGASSYVRHSRTLHQKLAVLGVKLTYNPILRVRYDAWAAFGACCSWLRLPEPLRGPFGTEELCAPSFAARYKQISEEQEALLKQLGTLKRPIDLIQFLDDTVRGSWRCLADDYKKLHDQLEQAMLPLERSRQRKQELHQKLRSLKKDRFKAEQARGAHFRAAIFEKKSDNIQLKKWEELGQKLQAVIDEIAETRKALRTLLSELGALAKDESVLKAHDRRRSIELEAELKRLQLIKSATVATTGLNKANHRPSAWWFPLVCAEGAWYRETLATAEFYLEPLS